jgi:hypothetical protein
MAEHMQDIRTGPATELDRWEAQLVAIAAHADIGQAESVARVEAHRRLVQAAASRIRRLLAHTDGLSATTRACLEIAFDRLRTELAAARPGDRAAFATEASPIADAVRVFDVAVDRAAEEGGEALIEDLGILARDFVATTDAFVAELAAAQWLTGSTRDAPLRAREGRDQVLEDDIAEVTTAISRARVTGRGPEDDPAHREAARAIARLRQTFQRLLREERALSPS